MVDLEKIPKSPGCYLFKDKEGDVIYVGKAKDLSKRVRSYFNRRHEVERLNVLVSRIDSVDFEAAPSACGLI